MKFFLLLLLWFFGSECLGQTDKISHLLNKQFQKEQKIYATDEKPIRVQPFQIINDSLQVEVGVKADEMKEEIWYFNRKVHLKDIDGFIKDINVLFTANQDSVKETISKKDKKGNVLETRTHYTHLFFTELGKDPKDKSLQKKMMAAFKKAGYTLSGEYWFN